MYQTQTDLRQAMEQEIRQRTRTDTGEALEPHMFTGLFQPDALAYWRSTGLPAEAIITIAFGPAVNYAQAYSGGCCGD